MAAPVRVPLDGQGAFTAALPDLGFGNRDREVPEWRLAAIDDTGAEHLVAFPGQVDEHWLGEPGGVLAWRRSRWGASAVHEIRHRPVVRDVRLEGDALVLGVDWLGAVPGQWSMALVGDRVRLPGQLRDGEVAFDTTCDEWGLGTATAPPGHYRLELTLPAGETTVAIEVAEELGEQAPVELLGERLRVRVRQSPRRALAVHLMAPLRDDELGVRAQQLQRDRFVAASYSLDPNAVYLQSYTGQAATDSPREIHDRLRVTHRLSRGDVDQIDPGLAEGAGNHHRVVAGDAALSPVGGGDTHRHRLVRRPRRAHCFKYLQRIAQPVFQRAAIFIGALVGER